MKSQTLNKQCDELGALSEAQRTNDHPEIDRLCAILAQDIVAAASGKLWEPPIGGLVGSKPPESPPARKASHPSPLLELAKYLEVKARGHSQAARIIADEFTDKAWADWHLEQAAQFMAWCVAVRESEGE